MRTTVLILIYIPAGKRRSQKFDKTALLQQKGVHRAEGENFRVDARWKNGKRALGQTGTLGPDGIGCHRVDILGTGDGYPHLSPESDAGMIGCVARTKEQKSPLTLVCSTEMQGEIRDVLY
jgi:hypothetical protein